MTDTTWVNGDGGFISDDSSFYGDDDTKAELENSTATISITDWNSKSSIDYNSIKAQNLASGQYPNNPNVKPVQLYNPGDGNEYCRQLSEPVSAFLNRLPPRTTPKGKLDAWIWIHDPLHKPTQNQPDLATFTARGLHILDELKTTREEYETQFPKMAKAGITRKVNPHGEQAVEDIYAAAKDCRILSGKWMLFPYDEDVNKVWGNVAEAVASSQLGPTAKVAPMEEGQTQSGKPRLICAYTRDFSDVKDVKRVLDQLIKMKLVKMGSSIWYKADAMTHLDLNSGNEWGIKPSLYSSKDLVNRVTDAAELQG